MVDTMPPVTVTVHFKTNNLFRKVVVSVSSDSGYIFCCLQEKLILM